MEARTRSRGRKKPQQPETDVDEEDEERAVPVVSGENKRKRAPRGGGSGRRVKIKALPNYDNGGHSEDPSGNSEEEEEENGRVDSAEGDATSGAPQRHSSRVKIKTFKLRENAESEVKPSRGRSDRNLKEDEPVKKVEVSSPPPTQKPLKVHITMSDMKQKPVSTPEPKATPHKPKAAAAASNSVPQTTSTPETQGGAGISAVDQAELDTALKVIRKLMRMDSAHPFNKPVDPVGQGVPDYLEIIDTPMDFGTICEMLEKKQKYANALDVYRDIQQIWTNCRKYNHKGDPILDLMKKVQKACSKYWTANGVLRDPKKPKKGEVPVPEEPPPDAAGTTGHKANCGCVVCVNMRRRSAREKRAVGLGSARAVKRQIAKLKGKQVRRKQTGLGGDGNADVTMVQQDLNEAEIEELMQLDEAYLEHMEEADHFYPASYQVPLRPVNPLVLSLGQALFGCKPQAKKMANPFLHLVSSYKPS